MQLSLVRFGANAGDLIAHGRQGAPQPSHEEELKPIEIGLSEDIGWEGAQGLLYSAAEFLIISITGCDPKG